MNSKVNLCDLVRILAVISLPSLVTISIYSVAMLGGYQDPYYLQNSRTR